VLMPGGQQCVAVKSHVPEDITEGNPAFAATVRS
jgi:hypothetical protein